MLQIYFFMIVNTAVAEGDQPLPPPHHTNNHKKQNLFPIGTKEISARKIHTVQ